jgi:hypothetical protein
VVFSATEKDRFSAQKPSLAKKEKRTLFTFEKPANFQTKANIFDVFVYESKASKSTFFDNEFLLSKILQIRKSVISKIDKYCNHLFRIVAFSFQ